MSQSVPGPPLPSPQRGDIFWVRIPQAHTEGSEFRDTDDGTPHAYVIVSRNSLNERSTAVVGVPLSSRLNKANRTSRPLIKSANLIGSNLDDSVALCDHIREISIKRLAGKVGRASTVAMALIENAVAFVLDGAS